MRIIIIAYGFTGSTLPLIKSLTSKGHEVDCYYLADPGITELEAFNFQKRYIFPGIHKIDIKKTNISSYFKSNDKITLNIVTIIRKRNKLKKIKINHLIDKIDNFTIKILCNKIKQKGYDAINVVGHMYPMDIIAAKFDKNKVWISLHEIYKNHLSQNKELTTVTKFAIDNNYQIIVHSSFIFNKIRNYTSKVTLIRFGPFETYNTYATKTESNSYLLFFGYILPYKGLELLYKAYQILKEKGLNIPIIIAGKGQDNYLELFSKEKNVQIIKKYISNQDLVSLINNCSYVICPYLSASQSGIPQTANALGKRVIATNVGAFAETIFNNENGYLVKTNDPEDMAKIIIEGLNNYEKEFLLTDYLNKHIEFNWSFICSKYITLFTTRI